MKAETTFDLKEGFDPDLTIAVVFLLVVLLYLCVAFEYYLKTNQRQMDIAPINMCPFCEANFDTALNPRTIYQRCRRHALLSDDALPPYTIIDSRPPPSYQE